MKSKISLVSLVTIVFVLLFQNSVFAADGPFITNRFEIKAVLTVVVLAIIVAVAVILILSLMHVLREYKAGEIAVFSLIAWFAGLLGSFIGLLASMAGIVLLSEMAGKEINTNARFIIISIASIVITFILEWLLAGKTLKKGKIKYGVLAFILALFVNAGSVLLVFEGLNRLIK